MCVKEKAKEMDKRAESVKEDVCSLHLKRGKSLLNAAECIKRERQRER